MESLRDKSFRNLITKDGSKYKDREYTSLSDKFKISTASLNTIEDLVFLGLKYDDKYIVPEYQRNLVWTLEQKQSLIRSVLLGNPIGDFLFKEERILSDVLYYTVIDGQQRLNALREFALGKFPLEDGKYLKDLKYWDARSFFEYDTYTGIKIKNISLEDEIELYIQRNGGGTTHTKDEINKAKEYLKRG